MRIVSPRPDFPVFMDPVENYPVGSPDWAGRMSARIWREYNAFAGNFQPMVDSMLAAVGGHPWLVWPPERPWGSVEKWAEALFAQPWHRVLEIIKEFDPRSARELQVLASEEQAKLLTPGGANNPDGCKGKPAEPIKHDQVMFDFEGDPAKPKAEQGNSAAYLLRRLSRRSTDPELTAEEQDSAKAALDGYRDGSIPSVRAAAKAAGIVKPPDTIKQLCRLWEKATADERDVFLNHINRS